SVLRTVNGVRVGVLGVADPTLAASLNVKAEDPVAAARREVERLHKAGAEGIIALAPVDRSVARRLAREAGAALAAGGRRGWRGAAGPTSARRRRSCGAGGASPSCCGGAARRCSTRAGPRRRSCARPRSSARWSASTPSWPHGRPAAGERLPPAPTPP